MALRALREFPLTELEDTCDKIFAISGYFAVKIYIKLVEERAVLTDNPSLFEEGKAYRKALIIKYKKIIL